MKTAQSTRYHSEVFRLEDGLYIYVGNTNVDKDELKSVDPSQTVRELACLTCAILTELYHVKEIGKVKQLDS